MTSFTFPQKHCPETGFFLSKDALAHYLDGLVYNSQHSLWSKICSIAQETDQFDINSIAMVGAVPSSHPLSDISGQASGRDISIERLSSHDQDYLTSLLRLLIKSGLTLNPDCRIRIINHGLDSENGDYLSFEHPPLCDVLMACYIWSPSQDHIPLAQTKNSIRLFETSERAGIKTCADLRLCWQTVGANQLIDPRIWGIQAAKSQAQIIATFGGDREISAQDFTGATTSRYQSLPRHWVEPEGGMDIQIVVDQDFWQQRWVQALETQATDDSVMRRRYEIAQKPITDPLWEQRFGHM